MLNIQLTERVRYETKYWRLTMKYGKSIVGLGESNIQMFYFRTVYLKGSLHTSANKS